MTDRPRLRDRLLGPRHVAFWALLASIVTVLAFVIGLTTKSGGHDSIAGTGIGGSPSVATPTATVKTIEAPSADPPDIPATSEVSWPPSTDALAIEAINIEIGDSWKVGSGLYSLQGRTKIEIRYWWTTITNYGSIDGSDRTCTVVATLSQLPSRKLVDSYRTAGCTLEGWVGMYASQGDHRIEIDVTLANGDHEKATADFKVIP